MANINVSVTCTNCGSTVVLNLETASMGGFCQSCCNCAGNVTGTYSADADGRVRIHNVRTMGGAKKR